MKNLDVAQWAAFYQEACCCLPCVLQIGTKSSGTFGAEIETGWQK